MIAIIPARGGSKGVPDKNIKLLNGKPLIIWTIEAAMASNRIDEVIVSTESQKIADIAKKTGAHVPFFRPEELADDSAKAIDTYIYTIDKLNNEYDYSIEEFIVLLPTSPLRHISDIDGAIDLFFNKHADSVMTYCAMNHPPEWAVKINEDSSIANYFDYIVSGKNRQEFPTAYICNGSVYVFRYALLKNSYSYFSNKTYTYIMPPERSVDIDTELDFMFAEYLMKNNG
jgi:CMP-N,N'-diacetyllegionaminic acid synthase